MYDSAGGGKIITALRERRQIEADIRALLACESEEEFRARAQQVAAAGGPVVSTIVANLGQANPRLLAAMGFVAAYLDHDTMAQALRDSVRLPGCTDQARVAAITLLERFLGEEPGQEMLGSLSDPGAVALASLQEVLAQVEANPALVIEYIQGLDRQHPDVVLSLVRALSRSGDEHAAELLRLIAQDVRPELAGAALQALGSLRLPAAAAALQTLQPVAAPELAPLAARMLRKLRFAGVDLAPLPPPDPDWRALISPVDGLGQQSVWLVCSPRTATYVRFLNVLITDRAGAVEALGHAYVSALMLPPPRRPGALHEVLVPGHTGAMLLLEAPFDLGRRLVLEALAHNRATQVPVAGALRLFSPWLWAVGGADALPRPRLPALDPAQAGQAGQLLEHRAFDTWTVQRGLVAEAVQSVPAQDGRGIDWWVRRLAGELFSDTEVAPAMSRRLSAMAEWLMWAGDEPNAQRALAAAEALIAGNVPAADQPFVRALLRRDLDESRVLRGPAHGADPKVDTDQFRTGE